MRRRNSQWLRTAFVLTVLVVTAAGCAARKRIEREARLASMPPEALYEQAMDELAQHRLRRSRQTLERIQFQFDPASRSRVEPLVKLAIADAVFYTPGGLSLIDARSLYFDFVTLYGTHPLAPYAQLQAGTCSLRQVHHPSRDQTETRQAIADLDELIRRHPGTRWASAGQDLKQQAEDNLAESEQLVGQFYLKRKAHGAAVERFRGLLDRFPTYVQRDKTLFQMASALVALDRKPEARVYLDLLLTDHPGGKWADEARDLLARLEGGAPDVAAEMRRPA